MVRGAAAGAAATVGMSALMFAARRAGLLGRMPPERITARALNRLGISRTRTQQDMMASALHIGFGAGAGALFMPLAARAPVNRVLLGLLYGTAVWAVSYMGWVPALGIMAPPSKDRPGRPQTMLAAHWVYGALLGLGSVEKHKA
ncbi:MAG TPA: DUF6789 family protein [Candidatus Dormibacteraeota bacterium]